MQWCVAKTILLDASPNIPLYFISTFLRVEVPFWFHFQNYSSKCSKVLPSYEQSYHQQPRMSPAVVLQI